jgi:hypothetical protein
MDADQFWEKVEKRGPDDCWPWQGTIVRGYGVTRYQGRIVRAHRLAYELTKGPIPAGMHVCHSCDRPGCVNPNHLWLGTASENAQDRENKGRGFKALGSANNQTFLTDHEVRTIRRMYASGKYSKGKLARIFTVSRKTVQNVLAGKIWKHVR